MVKKSKGKKGPEQGGKGGTEEPKEKVSEVDKEWFQIQIKSLEEKLQRRNEKMRMLEQNNNEYQERYEQLREDKADIIAYLKRTLQQRTDQISEYQARLEGLQQVHHADGQSYQAKLEKLMMEAARTKEQLVSENMVLAKKLDALEEFRIQRDQLMTKFEEQEKRMGEMKSDYEGRLERMEKKHILEEDRLKKDMMQKLESVAAEFRKASHAQMSATTQRTIRENVSISAEVTILSEKLSELTIENDALFEKNRDQQKVLTSLEEEQANLLHKNAYRLKVIEELTERCAVQKDQLQNVSSFHAERRQYEDRIGRLETELKEAKASLFNNLVSVKEKESTMSEIKLKLAGMSRTKDTINSCLTEASESIKSALALQEGDNKDSGPLTEADIKGRREEVLNQLLLMLNTAMSESNREQRSKPRYSEERTDEADEVDYLQGALGLVPIP